MRTSALASLTAIAGLALLPSAASAGSNPTPGQIQSAVRKAERSRSLWATINICNSRRYPYVLGVRGQMPTLGFASWLTMVVTAKYYSTSKKRFESTGVKTVRLGRLSHGLQQDGATFTFAKQTSTFTFEADIKFIWRRSGQLLGATTRRTSAGHRSEDYGSPPHYTAARCQMK
jgi:hypothetical protein